MDEEARVAEQIKVLSICWYVWAGLQSLGMCFGAIYAGFGGLMSAMIRADPNAPREAEMVGWLFSAIGLFVVLLFLVGAVCSFLSARWMTAKRNRTYSLVIAALACLSIPFGTVLGIFTFLVLQKPEAMALYDGDAARPAA